MKQVIILFVTMIFTQLLHADVYQCINANNHIEFRDKPCEANQLEEVLSEYVYVRSVDNPTPNNHLKHPEETKAKTKAKVNQKLSKTQLLAIERGNRKKIRLAKRAEKIELQNQQKRERQLKKQKRLEAKVKKLENQIKMGSKLKRNPHLQIDLEKQTKLLNEIRQK